jgi:hypothetical protein
MGKNWYKILYWFCVSAGILCGLLIIMALYFTVAKTVAKSGDFSALNLIFFSPYGIPVFMILGWLALKGARAVNRINPAKSPKI